MAIVLFLEGAAACTAQGGGAAIAEALRAAGHTIRRAALQKAGGVAAALQGTGPPSAIVADVRLAADLVPLRHLRRALVEVWGEAAAPPILGLLDERHLRQPDWPAMVDDFLLSPVAPTELAARLQLLLFRHRFLSGADELRFAGTRLHLPSNQAFEEAGGRVLPLTPREYELLRFLITHRGKFFSRQRLLDLVWGVDFTGGERTVDIHIRRLRSKLPAQTALLLETRRTVGYGFSLPVEASR